MLPIIAFLLSNTLYPPHDCFKCFGKDPERRYSVYQYTKEEHDIRKEQIRGEGLRKNEAMMLAASIYPVFLINDEGQYREINTDNDN